jgi:hypothetical protein
MAFLDVDDEKGGAGWQAVHRRFPSLAFFLLDYFQTGPGYSCLWLPGGGESSVYEMAAAMRTINRAQGRLS